MQFSTNLPLVSYIMKNIIKILVTDIKELSSLNKKNLIIFHEKYEMYDNLIWKLIFSLLILGFTIPLFGFVIQGYILIGSFWIVFLWWASLD